MPEYFKVLFPEQRDLFVDGIKMGQTQENIEIGKGTYTISLGLPRNYLPRWRRPTIKDTSFDAPLVLTFEKDPGGVP